MSDIPHMMHRGYEVHYSENRDLWACDTLGFEDKSLAKLTDKINKFEADQRRLPGTPALEVTRYNHERKDVRMTLLDGNEVWVMSEEKTYPRFHSRSEPIVKTVRRKVKIADLCPDTPEVRAAIDAIRALEAESRALSQKISAAYDALPRLTVEQVKAGVPK